MKKPIKVAISQRICPDWRVHVFRELSKRSDIDLMVYFGKGLSSGSQRNAERIEGFKYNKLFTIPFNIQDRGTLKYRVFHPSLPFHLIFGDFDVVIVEPSTNFFNDILTFPICKFLGKKFIWYEAGFSEKFSFFRRLINPFVRLMIRGADIFITYNSFADKCLLQLGVRKSKVFRAQNTLNVEQLIEEVKIYSHQVRSLRKKLCIESAKVIGFIGGIEKRKRIENLIKASLIVKNYGLNVKVLIIGDGPYTDELKNNLSEEEREITLFVGRHTEDSTLYIQASDLVVLPGQGGLAITHALACGKPCLATLEAYNDNAVYDYIKDGINGFVVNINNVSALARKMFQLFEDTELYSHLSQGALKSRRKFTIKKMVDGIEKAIRYAVSA